MALQRGEGTLAASGALVTATGARTGRSPDDKFVVRYPGSASERAVWWGDINQPLPPERFARLAARVSSYLLERDALYVTDATVAAHPAYRMPVRVIAEEAWQALFARQLFRRDEGPAGDEPNAAGATVLIAPHCQAVTVEDGTRSEAAVVLDLEHRLVVICGTRYAGELKKSVFSLLNYLLPQRGVLSMHCAANVGDAGDSALFFGLSGTGKTTLSADPARNLLGDDEHGWSDEGIFNLEGGCYAKCIRLSQEDEPQIWHAIRFGSVVENVVVDPATRQVDYDDDSITENTRCAYPVDYIEGALTPGTAGHPTTVLFLTADAFGAAAAPGAAQPRTGALPLPLRLHRAASRNRGRAWLGTRSDVLCLLRRTVPTVAALGLRPLAGRAPRGTRLALLSGQYRLDRRPLWRRPTPPHRRHTLPGTCGDQW